MKHKITQRGVFAVSAKTIDERKPEVVALMQRYGMNVNVNDSKGKIDMAFLSLLPRSRGFRKDFAALATPVAESMHNEYKNACGDCYANASSDPMKDIMNIPSKGIGTSSSLSIPSKTFDSNTGVAPAKSKKAFSDTGFGSWLSDVFDKDTTQNIINTGLGIYAYQKTGGTQGANPLTQGRSDVQGQTPTPPAGEQGSSTGLGTGGIVVIALGALALVGFGIYYATKK
jgi:hypothetical protein